MKSPKLCQHRKDYFELLQNLEYLSLYHLISVMSDKFNSFIECVAFLTYHLKIYLNKENCYFFDLKEYDLICSFFPPPTMPNHQVTAILQKTLKLQRLPNKDTEPTEYKIINEVAIHRLRFEDVTGLSCLTAEQAKILEIKDSKAKLLEAGAEANTPEKINKETLAHIIRLLIDHNPDIDLDSRIKPYAGRQVHNRLQYLVNNKYTRQFGGLPSHTTISKYLNE